MTDAGRPQDGATLPPYGGEDRAASSRGIEFNKFDESERAPTLDPAQQSLASALTLTFRFVQLVMLLLGIAFLISGVQTVGESERGLKLIFGKVTASDVQPGMRWNWPYPVGEVVKVRISQQSLDLGPVFMPFLNVSQRSKPWTEIADPKPRLIPGKDGSVITADGALAHLECSVTFHHADPVANAKNIYSADEENMVRAAVERGIVLAASEMTIDQLLRQSTNDATTMGSLESRIRQAAQRTLDATDSGIRLDDVNVRDPRAPLAVFKNFDAVARAEAEASKNREDADRASRLKLNQIAGESHQVILERIDAYEREIELHQDAEAEAVLAQIDALLEGEQIEIEGQRYVGLTSGDVTKILNDARQYRTDVVATARSRVETFMAKLAQFRLEPRVLISTDWTRAYRAFIESGQYETILVPAGATGDIMLSADPDIPKQIEARRNRQQAADTIQGRIEGLTSDFDKKMEQKSTESATQRRTGGNP